MAIEFSGQFNERNFSPIAPGDYEVVLDKVDKGITLNGTPRLKLTFKIREDVEQDFKGRLIWETLWLDKREDYAKDGWFDMGRLEKIILSQPDGKRTFNSADEVLVYLNGLHMLVTIENSEPRWDDKKGDYVTDSNIVRYSHRPSVWDVTPHTATAPKVSKPVSDPFNGGDLPF